MTACPTTPPPLSSGCGSQEVYVKFPHGWPPDPDDDEEYYDEEEA
jgi:hypothetical protein